MTVMAIDPGDKYSAWVVYDDSEADGVIVDKGYEVNANVLKSVAHWNKYVDHLAIEMIASYGMAVGRSVFETCVMVGRCIQLWDPDPYTLVYRKDVKMHLCNSMRAKDANVRQVLLDRFGPPGTKGKEGPTYHVIGDMWSALAVAVTWCDTVGCADVQVH